MRQTDQVDGAHFKNMHFKGRVCVCTCVHLYVCVQKDPISLDSVRSLMGMDTLQSPELSI